MPTVCVLNGANDLIYILGTSEYGDSRNPGYKYELLCLNSSGSLIWSKSYTKRNSYNLSLPDCKAKRVFVDNDGIIMFGTIDHDIYIVNTDFSGNIIWDRIINTGGYLDVHIEKYGDNGFIVFGKIIVTADENAISVLRLDSIGNTKWSKSYPGAWVNSGLILDNGNILTLGKYNDTILLFMIDGEGSMLWSEQYTIETNYNVDIEGYDVYNTSDGGYIIAGTCDRKSSNYKERMRYQLLVKTDENGKVENYRVENIIDPNNNTFNAFEELFFDDSEYQNNHVKYPLKIININIYEQTSL